MSRHKDAAKRGDDERRKNAHRDGEKERIQYVGRMRPGNVSKRVSGNEAIE
jgi:hypothetical protein